MRSSMIRVGTSYSFRESSQFLLIFLTLINAVQASYRTKYLSGNCQGQTATLSRSDVLNLHVNTHRMSVDYCFITIELFLADYVTVEFKEYKMKRSLITGSCAPYIRIKNTIYCGRYPAIGYAKRYNVVNSKLLITVDKRKVGGSLSAWLKITAKREPHEYTTYAPTDTGDSSLSATPVITGVICVIILAMVVIVVCACARRRRLQSQGRVLQNRQPAVHTNFYPQPTYPAPPVASGPYPNYPTSGYNPHPAPAPHTQSNYDPNPQQYPHTRSETIPMATTEEPFGPPPSYESLQHTFDPSASDVTPSAPPPDN